MSTVKGAASAAIGGFVTNTIAKMMGATTQEATGGTPLKDQVKALSEVDPGQLAQATMIMGMMAAGLLLILAKVGTIIAAMYEDVDPTALLKGMAATGPW